ncbi:MAG: hybrid sensor histidine kinase/response regulator, partial [Cyanobacteria bacterium P01_F01_bin.86]
DSMLRIKQQYDDLQSLLKLRENMVDMIVCDLRVPLRSALLGLDLLENEVLSQERRKEILTTAYSSAQTLEIMVDDLLKIALVESGKIHLCRVKVNPCEFIQAMVSELKKNITSEHCQLVMQFPEEPIRDIFIDVTLVRRCLHYLLMNVFLFTEVNSQVILKLVILSPEEFKIQAIDPKLRYSKSLNRNLSGKYELGTLMSNTTQIGLELTFSKMVVEAHNGRINISQNESQGTILEVALSG